MKALSNLRNEFVVLFARRLAGRESVLGDVREDDLVADTFRRLESMHRVRISTSTRRQILRTIDVDVLRNPVASAQWADEVLKSASGILGVDLRALRARVASGLTDAVRRAARRDVRTEPKRAPVAVKVCGLHDRPSALAALSAARAAGSSNLVLGLLLGITHAARDKLTSREGADLLRYIRETSYSLDQPVKIACVTHLTSASKLVRMVHDIERRAFEGEEGLDARARTAEESSRGIGDRAMLTEGSASGRGEHSVRLAKRPLFDIIQIHDDMPIPEIEKVKAAFPESMIIKALHVPKSGEKRDLAALERAAVDLARRRCIDGLLLDSAKLSANQIGGTGLLNDWDVARAIVDAVHRETSKPVALAGGLAPENARRAFEYTRADMIDANTGFRFDRKPDAWRAIGRSEVSPKNAFDILEVLEAMRVPPASPRDRDTSR